MVRTGSEVALSRKASKIGAELSVCLYAHLDDGRAVRLSPFSGWSKALSDGLGEQGIAASAQDLAGLTFDLGTSDELSAPVDARE